MSISGGQEPRIARVNPTLTQRQPRVNLAPLVARPFLSADLSIRSALARFSNVKKPLVFPMCSRPVSIRRARGPSGALPGAPGVLPECDPILTLLRPWAQLVARTSPGGHFSPLGVDFSSMEEHFSIPGGAFFLPGGASFLPEGAFFVPGGKCFIPGDYFSSLAENFHP